MSRLELRRVTPKVYMRVRDRRIRRVIMVNFMKFLSLWALSGAMCFTLLLIPGGSIWRRFFGPVRG